MKTVLVTGGAGFIGSCLVRQLLAETNSQIVNFDKLTYAGDLSSLNSIRGNSRYTFVQGDINDQSFFVDVLETYCPDAIVHLAAETHVDRSIDDPERFVTTNVVGTLRLLEATRNYWNQLTLKSRERFRLLHVSTDEVYGSALPHEHFTERARFCPNSPYAASKAAADHLVRAYFTTFGFPVLNTNCSNNYGPYQFPEKLIPRMILGAAAGTRLPIYGDGQNARDWIFVDDHCSAIRLVLEKGVPGQTYNIGSGSIRTNLEVVAEICKLVDEFLPDIPHKPSSQLITLVTDRPGHDLRYSIDATKIRTELGWHPAQDWRVGLERTVAWYLENDDWLLNASSRGNWQQRLGLHTRFTPAK